ncbi:MAG: hypothetical protein K8Q97_01170 [Candidatus Andersenbacteria bacterium]|nr:hypothetical protein [Candidatus Andersenbacteria bacterium]
MNSFSNIMQRIKNSILHVVLYSMSIISILFFAIGGVCAAIVVYVYALQSPVIPPDLQVTVQSSVSVAKSALTEVQKYASLKEESAKKNPVVNSSVFYIPPAK